MHPVAKSGFVACFAYCISVLLFQVTAERYLSYCFLSVVVFFIAMQAAQFSRNIQLVFAILCSGIFLAQNFYFYQNLDVIVGPDEFRFNEGFNYFVESKQDYFLGALRELVDGYIFMSSSYPIFGSLLYPILYLSGAYDPQLIVFLNLSLLVFLVYSAVLLSGKYGVYLFLILLSPQVLYHSNIYAKDILALLLMSLSLYALVKRNWFSLVIFGVLATALRPYSLVVVFIYFVVFIRPSRRLLYVTSFLAVLLCVYAGGIAALVNLLLTSQYLIVSPNPFSIERPDYIPLYFEAWGMMIMYFAVLFLILRYRVVRSAFLPFMSSLVLYSGVMVLMGIFGSVAYDFEYEAGALAGNIVRKKIMVMPLIYIFIVGLVSSYLLRGRPVNVGS